MADIKGTVHNSGVPLITKKRVAEAEAATGDKTRVSEANSETPASGKFTKPYTPAERAKQAEALEKFLAARK
jgi:hypothetical protein